MLPIRFWLFSLCSLLFPAVMEEEPDFQPDEGWKLEAFARWETGDICGLEKKEIKSIRGSPAFCSNSRDEHIAKMPMHGLRALLQEKSLPDRLRYKIRGELAARHIAAKGKAAATSNYDTGESSTNTSSLSSPIRTEIRQSSELDHVSIPPAPLKFSMVADRITSRTSLNDHTQGTAVSTCRGSSESTLQCYPLPHPPLTASRNEEAHLQESNAKCRDNHNVGRAGATVLSSEPTAHNQPPPAYAPAGADIEAGASTTCSEPPPETMAIFNESAADVLLAGAFTLLSRNSGTYRRPVERVLLGVIAVGFISNFTWQLMGRRGRSGRLSVLLQWTSVWAKFAAFFLIMTLLITQ